MLTPFHLLRADRAAAWLTDQFSHWHRGRTATLTLPAALAMLLSHPGQASAALTLDSLGLDPTLYLASHTSEVMVDAKRVGRYTSWIDYSAWDPTGALVHVQDGGENYWVGDASAQADYGHYSLSTLTKIWGDAYTYGDATAHAASTEYMVLSPIVPGTTTITNIAHYQFTLHGSVPQCWVDDKTIMDDAETGVNFAVRIRTSHGYYVVYDDLNFTSPCGDFVYTYDGDFTFDIDEVIKIDTEFWVETLLRPLPTGPTFVERDHASNGAVELNFGDTLAWTGLALPEGIMVAATASGTDYPVNYDVPEPASLWLMATGGLLLAIRKRKA